MTARGLRSLTVLLSMLLAALGGCRSRELTPLGCKNDNQCATGQGCLASVCVTRANPTGTWSVELVPPNDSSSALTELNDLTFTDPGPTLIASNKAVITGNLGPGAPTNVAAHVVATVPALIPGRPDLQFEAEWPAGSLMTPTQFLLNVPGAVLGETGVLKVLPTAPDDRKQAPISVMATMARDMWISLPTEAVTLRGRLVSALREPRDGFLARVFQGGQVVSNLAETQSGGMFSLTIPTANIAGDPMRAITVELAPKDDKAADPRFTTHTVTLGGNADLGDLHLPTFSQPNAYRFDVRGDDDTPISGAVVHARASIDGSPDGTAEYVRGGLTDSKGIADLSLLPGTVETSRPYNITVIPPSDSPFGVLCVPEFPLAAGGTIATPALARKINLPRRPVLSGNVVADDGSAAASLTVTATRIDSTPENLGQCGSAAVAAPGTVTTDKNGRYTMPLDPGAYRLDYDPPLGAAIPRMTEPSVTITGDLPHDIDLPPVSLVEGIVQDPGGNALAGVVVHLFKVQCQMGVMCAPGGAKDPLLWAVGRTDSGGKFRMVVPAREP